MIAHDLHPDYLSTKYAQQQKLLPTVAVQHHHAHIASCLAEHGVNRPVIGLALDGTGYGADGRIWGGEVLLADLTSFKRVAHLEYLPLPGGDGAARFPWRMALVYLDRAYGDELFDLDLSFVRDLDEEQTTIILQMARQGVNSPLTSSCGRFFDAISALLGVRRIIAYEGQAAVELDMCQSRGEKGGYPWEIGKEGGQRVMLTTGIVRGVVDDITKGMSKGVISGRFHNTLINMFTEACVAIRDETSINQVALSGGSFQNQTLLIGLTRSLKAKGFAVLSHAQVPTNDGGLALGQAVCAGWRYAGVRGRYEEAPGAGQNA
jgi:hydrogenase maturation protein HypF